MNYKKKIDIIEKHVKSYFKRHSDMQLFYHNIHHTCDVVAACIRIAEGKLPEEDLFVLLSAAWFHDIGYLGGHEDHEEIGSAQALEFISGIDVPGELILRVEEIIMATKMPTKPVTEIEKIICDADLFHLGTSDYAVKNKAYKKEYEALQRKNVDRLDWLQKELSFLDNHHFYTSYCQENLSAQQAKNRQCIVEKIDREKELVSKPEKNKTDQPGK